MCAKCRANTALAKEMAKQVRFPADPRTPDEIWFAGMFDDSPRAIEHEEAELWVRRAYETIKGLEVQGFEIVER
jgi:hypothetical protein